MKLYRSILFLIFVQFLVATSSAELRKVKPYTLNFSNGKSFKITGDMSHIEHNINKVLLTADNQVLRIPVNNHGLVKYEATLGFVSAISTLEKDGVTVVKILEFLPYEYVLVENLSLITTLDSMVVNQKDFSKEVKTKAFNDLMVFVRKTAHYAHIGDFNFSQIGYTGTEWVLFDATADHLTVENHLKEQIWIPFHEIGHIFQNYFSSGFGFFGRASFDVAFGLFASRKIDQEIKRIRKNLQCAQYLKTYK